MVWNGRYEEMFIGGRWRRPEGSKKLAVISPITEQSIASVPVATAAEVDLAVEVARQTFNAGPWTNSSLGHRIETLRRFRDLYADHGAELAELITAEMGCPISMSAQIQVGTPLAILDAYLNLAREYPFRTLRSSGEHHALVTKVPVGVVAAILPWNVPQSVLMMKLAPALLTGCSIIIKPAPETPLDSYLVADLLVEAGVPEGVVSVLPADREISEYLATHPGVDKVAFTGSTAVGAHLASVCGADLKRLTLELGGKSAAIFLDDADIAASVERLRMLSLRNSGQVCSLKTRIVVPRAIEGEVLDAISALLVSMPVGDPRNPETQIGPVVSDRQRLIVNGYIESGLAQGARIVAQSAQDAIPGTGWFVRPTVFADVNSSMRIAQEEIFGPVLAVLTYDTVDEAVAIANDSQYGLNGAVFTTDAERGLAVAERLRTGTAEINGHPTGFYAPIGGFKRSGLGREAGLEGFDAYVEPQSIGLPVEFAHALRAAIPKQTTTDHAVHDGES